MTQPSRTAPVPPEGLGLAAGRDRLGIGFRDIWIAYFGVGGNGTSDQVERWLSGIDDVPSRDHNFLAQVLNEEFAERGGDHPVRYQHDE